MTTPSSYRDKDDLGRPRSLALNGGDSSWHTFLRFRRKRRSIFVFLSICTIVYLLVHSRWWADVQLFADGPPSDHPASVAASGPDDHHSDDHEFSSAPASHNAVPVDAYLKQTDPKMSKYTYNGPIRFLGLYETLSKLQQFSYKLRNRHVVFVAANMNTASILAGVACEMSQTKRNVVHLALVGRNELSVEFFKKANGMTGDACGVIVHDARPDYASVSTDERMGLALKSAVKYMKDYFTPTVLISDLDREDPWFQKAIVQKTKELGMTHIKMPSDASTIPWFQKLDSVSLSAWDKPLIDIVIHADAHSGQLIRLLKSLKNANYFTAKLPRLFIDLDPDTDKHIRDFVNEYSWPSKDRLFVRHRISPKSASLNDDPLAVAESYYPNSQDSSVLYLSPNIELSPFYYHFLYYSILEYKYSNAQSSLDKNFIYGISLDTPLSFFNGEPFDPSDITTPSSSSNPPTADSDKNPALTPFLHTSSSYHATLFFGTHWRLFHLYLTKRLDTAYNKDVDYTLPIQPSKSLPVWIKYFSEMLTAGGYVMLYPNYDPSESLAVYHTEKKSRDSSTHSEKSIMRDNNIVNFLPGKKLPLWSEMPILATDGGHSTIEELVKTGLAYKWAMLRKCGGPKKDDGEEDSVDDLFCAADEAVTHQRRKIYEAKKKVEEEEREADEKAQREASRPDAPKPQEQTIEIGEVKLQRSQNDAADFVPKAKVPANVRDEIKESEPKPDVYKTPVIPHKIVSLDDLENVPVEINGEKVIAIPKDSAEQNSRKESHVDAQAVVNANKGGAKINVKSKVQPAGEKVPEKADENSFY
ncbi:hypothetical protein H072_10478 [Dactylellina haptotyla CBS 200.50]|uniref:Uncharacterized protein n=1 Tax=Dactylellina haptotyla (strain CBS 200.50) TaxID=1284197 RepID=S8A4Q0_DACHA|nr:hypothetical protein H072_10478 [Dactylellina haptotyla CBS 200.50]